MMDPRGCDDSDFEDGVDDYPVTEQTEDYDDDYDY